MRALPFALLACTLLGCTGEIGDSPQDEPLSIPDEPQFDPEAPLPPFAPGPGTMPRLTQSQYRAIVTDTFGDLEFRVQLEGDEETASFSTHGAAQVTTSSQGVEQYRDAALDLAAQIMDNRSAYPVLAGCMPDQASAPCIREVVQTFGHSLFRRTLTDDELERYAAIAAAAGDEPDLLNQGLRYVIAGLLQSPHFLYAPTIGRDQDGRRAYRGQEVATRLALLLWNHGPDDALIDAAEAGRLDTAEGIRTEALRMLEHDFAADLATRFFDEAWRVDHLQPASKAADHFPAWSEELLESFRGEMDLVLKDLTWERNGDLLEIFDGDETFVDARLAEFYGLEGPSGQEFERVALGEERSGLLTSGAVIAANSPGDRSTPTERGVFILERLRCRNLPAPPASALAEAEDELAMIEPGDERAFIENRLEDPSCGGCHQTIDPLGMVFDEFNAIGRHRLGEDAVGALGTEPFDSVRELGQDLREDGEASWCIVRRLYAYSVGREATEGEAAAVVGSGVAFGENGHSFRELMLSIVTSDGFRFYARDRE